MGPEGMILVNPPITTFQQSLTHSAVRLAKQKKWIEVRRLMFFPFNVAFPLFRAAWFDAWWPETDTEHAIIVEDDLVSGHNCDASDLCNLNK